MLKCFAHIAPSDVSPKSEHAFTSSSCRSEESTGTVTFTISCHESLSKGLQLVEFVKENLAVIVVLFVTVQSQTDYCDRELCKSGNGEVRPHIGCNNGGQLAGNCPSDTEIVVLTEKQKNLFLKIHNRLRDRFARGAVKPFKPAAKMPMLKWNDELAKLAEFNVKTCKFAHDKCRSTEICRYAGQNLGQMQSYPSFLDINIAIKNITREWFREYK
uniref:Uncharacterized protein n=1 Tax=Phlebotomus papatasi TaxID=29031 RepID=A0A1B0GPW3_PHLPP